ncbi:MFS transporter [Algihabitans albus]|uniref:MFS transporter n=1 Tax=Algihabitans albus TaxID=2164067 RepID=UPI000E5CF292|nr:MFS transporter [Algihabitans albus]
MSSSTAGRGVAVNSARLVTVVVLTTAVQTVGSWAVLSFPALATEIGSSLAVEPVFVGSLVSLVYGVAMLLSLVAGQTLRRYGACRQSQAALIAFALACAAAASGNSVGMLVAGLLLGIGYGLINPATSHLLAPVVPPERRNIVFSLKQTGVPLGGILAGLATPAVAVAFGWQTAIGSLALVSLLLATALAPLRPGLDDDRDANAPIFGRPLAGLSLVLRLSSLRWLSIAVFFLSAIQLSLGAYLVVFLVEEVGLGLVAAGALLAATQAAGFSGRLIWGWLADRLGDGNGVMLGLAAVMLLAALATTLVTPSWPLVAVSALFLVFGVAAIGWNGVFMAEIARLAPRGEVGNATAGALVLTFGGVLFGPSFFALAYAGIGSYALTFGGLALAALAAGISLVAGRKISSR